MKSIIPSVTRYSRSHTSMISVLPTREHRPHLGRLTPDLVCLEDVRKDYISAEVPVHALRGVSLTINRGEFVAVMGASGSGKSTLMNILGCLDRPTSGQYILDGTDVSTLSRNQLADLRNRKLGFIFQGFNLLSRATALENVELPMLCGSLRRLRPLDVREHAMQHLAQVGLAERANHFPNQLSGGQQQRVAIARALVNQPDIILADEPTGNLDTSTSLDIMAIFQGLNETGITIVMVTHETQIARFCTRTLLIRDGVLERDHCLPIATRRQAADELQTMGRRDEPT
jgi:putative ABC transport system ATP-binding protein